MTRQRALDTLDRIAAETPAVALEFVRFHGDLRLFLTTRELAEHCNVHDRLVLSWINHGYIHSAKTQLRSNCHLFPARELAGLPTEGNTLEFETVRLRDLRLYLKTGEVAQLCGVHDRLVLLWIQLELIRSARDKLGCAHHAVPVGELARLVELAA